MAATTADRSNALVSVPWYMRCSAWTSGCYPKRGTSAVAGVSPRSIQYMMVGSASPARSKSPSANCGTTKCRRIDSACLPGEGVIGKRHDGFQNLCHRSGDGLTGTTWIPGLDRCNDIFVTGNPTLLVAGREIAQLKSKQICFQTHTRFTQDGVRRNGIEGIPKPGVLVHESPRLFGGSKFGAK